MGYALMPYTKVNGKWSLPDDFIKYVWYQMVEQNRAYTTFYDGSVKTAQEFLEFMQEERNFPVFVFSEDFKDVYMVAWLNGLGNRTAQCHFCCIGKYKRGLGEEVLKYWGSLKHADKRPLFLTIWGITPSEYKQALKMLKLVGMKIVGEIPNACYMAYSGEYVSGVISYYCPEEKINAEKEV